MIKIADITGLQAFIMGIVGIAMTIGIGMYVLTTFSTAEGLNNTTAGTKVGELSTKLGGAVTWIGILILVVFASAVLVYFYNR